MEVLVIDVIKVSEHRPHIMVTSADSLFHGCPYAEHMDPRPPRTVLRIRPACSWGHVRIGVLSAKLRCRPRLVVRARSDAGRHVRAGRGRRRREWCAGPQRCCFYPPHRPAVATIKGRRTRPDP